MCCILLLFSCYLVNQQCAYICTYVCVFVVAGGTIQECSTPAMCLENASPWLPRSPSMGLVNTCCCPPSADTAHTQHFITMVVLTHSTCTPSSLVCFTPELWLTTFLKWTPHTLGISTVYACLPMSLCLPAPRRVVSHLPGDYWLALAQATQKTSLSSSKLQPNLIQSGLNHSLGSSPMLLRVFFTSL